MVAVDIAVIGSRPGWCMWPRSLLAAQRMARDSGVDLQLRAWSASVLRAVYAAGLEYELGHKSSV